MKKLLLIDSNAVIHRAYHAIPKTFKTRSGEQTNAVYGYTTTLIKAIEDIQPDYIAASFDISKATFRHEQYSEYKATRVKADQELYDQIPRVKELLNKLNIPIYEKEGYEADDVIGTISTIFEHRSNVIPAEAGIQSIGIDSGSQDTGRNDSNKKVANEEVDVYIVTGDKDTFQLVDGNIFIYNLKAGLSQTQIVDRAKIKEDWGLDPEDFIDLKALAGDPSDNIPGVPGIGPKTAIALLQNFDTLVGLYESIEAVIPDSIRDPETIGMDSGSQDAARNDKLAEASKSLNIKPRILNLLIEYKDQAFLSQKLATIYRQVPIDFNLEKCKWGDYDKQALADFFREMSFHSLLKRFGIEAASEPKTKQAREQKEKDQQLKLL